LLSGIEAAPNKTQGSFPERTAPYSSDLFLQCVHYYCKPTVQMCTVETAKEYDVLKAQLDTLSLYAPDEIVWTIAYETGFSLRRKGITTPTVDILICSIAKRNELAILHHDEHIRIIARILGIESIDYLKIR
jgi:hypothetical protein